MLLNKKCHGTQEGVRNSPEWLESIRRPSWAQSLDRHKPTRPQSSPTPSRQEAETPPFPEHKLYAHGNKLGVGKSMKNINNLIFWLGGMNYFFHFKFSIMIFVHVYIINKGTFCSKPCWNHNLQQDSWSTKWVTTSKEETRSVWSKRFLVDLCWRLVLTTLFNDVFLEFAGDMHQSPLSLEYNCIMALRLRWYVLKSHRCRFEPLLYLCLWAITRTLWASVISSVN